MPAKKITANDVISKRLRSIRADNDITQAKIAKTAEHDTDSRKQVGTAVRHHEC
ncbi:MAG: hypothetical protein ACLS5M_10225 [Ruminococcus sp.]